MHRQNLYAFMYMCQHLILRTDDSAKRLFHTRHKIILCNTMVKNFTSLICFQWNGEKIFKPGKSEKNDFKRNTTVNKMLVCTTECSQVNVHNQAIVNKLLHYYRKFQLKATMPIDSSALRYVPSPLHFFFFFSYMATNWSRNFIQVEKTRKKKKYLATEKSWPSFTHLHLAFLHAGSSSYTKACIAKSCALRGA